MADSHVITAVVKHKFRVVLVDCVVGQMYEWLFQVGSSGLDVSLSCKTG